MCLCPNTYGPKSRREETFPTSSSLSAYVFEGVSVCFCQMELLAERLLVQVNFSQL